MPFLGHRSEHPFETFAVGRAAAAPRFSARCRSCAGDRGVERLVGASEAIGQRRDQSIAACRIRGNVACLGQHQRNVGLTLAFGEEGARKIDLGFGKMIALAGRDHRRQQVRIANPVREQYQR